MPIKFLSDENIGFEVIFPLRDLDFDIRSILEGHRGADDEEVLFLANAESRIIITTDKDFGELVYVQKLVNAGVILLRLKDDSSENKFNVLQSLFKSHLDELIGSFTVIKDNKVRINKM